MGNVDPTLNYVLLYEDVGWCILNLDARRRSAIASCPGALFAVTLKQQILTFYIYIFTIKVTNNENLKKYIFLLLTNSNSKNQNDVAPNTYHLL